MFSITSCYDFSREQRLKDAENDGKAILVESENSKKAIVEQALAEAQAIQIIKAEFNNSTEYLDYLKIKAINEIKEGDRIYIATEAGLPVTEARPLSSATTSEANK